jgi:hypothetical protein
MPLANKVLNREFAPAALTLVIERGEARARKGRQCCASPPHCAAASARVRPPPWERLPILALARPRSGPFKRSLKASFRLSSWTGLLSSALKALGLMEERGTGVVISAEGRRVLRALITKS